MELSSWIVKQRPSSDIIFHIPKSLAIILAIADGALRCFLYGNKIASKRQKNSFINIKLIESQKN